MGEGSCTAGLRTSASPSEPCSPVRKDNLLCVVSKDWGMKECDCSRSGAEGYAELMRRPEAALEA